jgi:thiol-disulfide isomerase/thioredoxin
MADRNDTEDRKKRRKGLWWLLAAALALIVLIVVLVVLGIGGGDDTAVTTGSTSADAGSATTPNAPPGPTQEVNVAPDFSVTLFDGTEFTLSEHLASDGRPVFLNLWASWCDPCRAEMPDIDAAAEAHPEVFFLGVAVDDTREAAQTFAETISVMYPLGADDSGEVGDSFPRPGLPASYLIDGDGIVVNLKWGSITDEQIERMLTALENGS